MRMTPKLAIVELRVRNWPAAVAWFRDHFQLTVKLEHPAEQYALLEAGNVQLAIKGDADAVVGNHVLLQWEVDDVVACQSALVAAGVRIVKPMKASDEGYRRIVVEGPEGLVVVVFDWVVDGNR